MIRTWIADVTPLYEQSVYEAYYNIVPTFRKEKADRIKDADRKAQSIGAWILYQRALEKCKNSNPVFNLSHSGAFVLCSVEDGSSTDVKVGCDIEEIKTFHNKLIRRYFCSSEADYIFEQPDEATKNNMFYRYWVLKESFMKATREGMRLGMDTFEIDCKSCETPQMIRKPERFPEPFYYKEYVLDIPFRIAVCSTSNQFAEEIQKVRL